MPRAAIKRQPNARPAKFAADPERRVLIAKVHVAKKEMALVDDDYRQMLLDVTGRTTSAECSIAELRALIEEMKSKGFRPRPSTGQAAKSGTNLSQVSDSKPASHPFAGKARALWISLYHLGAIDNPSEQALEAFARRQLKCDRMQWANQAQAYKLVEALKAIANRNGWNQRTDFAGGIRKTVKADVSLRVLKVRLVERIVEKLREAGLVPVDWQLARVAFDLAGMERPSPDAPDKSVPVPLWDLGDLDLLAKALGEKLRGAGK